MSDRLSVSAGFCIFLAIMILVLPLQWVIAMVIAAAFHELCHYFAIRICGCRLMGISLNAQAAQMPLPQMSSGKELFCALAGPIGSLFLMVLLRWMPRVAICGMMQGLYNLLPAYPMDGGRVLRCCTSLIFSPPTAKKVADFIERTVYILLLFLGFYATFILHLGFLPLIMALLLCLRTKTGKIPCKPEKERVQYRYTKC